MITGSMTFSSNCPASAPKATVTSLPASWSTGSQLVPPEGGLGVQRCWSAMESNHRIGRQMNEHSATDDGWSIRVVTMILMICVVSELQRKDNWNFAHKLPSNASWCNSMQFDAIRIGLKTIEVCYTETRLRISSWLLVYARKKVSKCTANLNVNHQPPQRPISLEIWCLRRE